MSLQRVAQVSEHGIGKGTKLGTMTSTAVQKVMNTDFVFPM